MGLGRAAVVAAVAALVQWLPVAPASGTGSFSLGPPFERGWSSESCTDGTAFMFTRSVQLCQADASVDAATGAVGVELHVGSPTSGVPLLDGYGSADARLYTTFAITTPAQAVDLTVTVTLGTARATRDPLPAHVYPRAAAAHLSARVGSLGGCGCGAIVSENVVCTWDCRPGADHDRSGETMVLRLRMHDEGGGPVTVGRYDLSVDLDAYGWSTGGWYDIEVDAVVGSVVAEPRY